MPRVILGKLLADLADCVPYRQNTRLPVIIPITISGNDIGGLAFEEGTQTIDVGKQGIRTSTRYRLAPDTQVRISNGMAEKFRAARVVWQARADSADSRAEMGVEFLESMMPEGFAPHGSLPDDWMTGRLQLTASQKLEYFWARMKTFPVSPELRAMVESAKSVSDDELDDFTFAGPATQSAAPSRTANNTEITQSNPEENQDAGIGGELSLPPATGDAETVTMASAATPSPTDSPEILKGRTRSLSRTHARKGRREFPVEELNRLAKTLTEQADTISKSIDEASGLVRKAAEDAVAQVRNAQQETESRMKALNAEFENRIAELAKSSMDELRTQAETSLSNLRAELQQIEARIKELQNDSNRQVAERTAPSSNDASANREASLAEFREQLKRGLNEFREVAAQELQDQLRRGAANLREVSAMEQKELAVKSAALQQANDDYASGRFTDWESDAAQPKRKPLDMVFILALIMAMATLVGGFAFFSTQPQWQLQATPPAEFFDSKVSRNMQPAEEELARAYWKCAVNVIQKSYSFGTALPAQPPPDFSIQPQDVAKVRSKAYLDASRERYWQKLERVWAEPRVWVQTYQWNTDWLLSPLKALGLKLRG